MMILRFKSSEDHKDLLKKVKKMKEFSEDLEDCLMELMEEGEAEYRGGRYREDDEEDYNTRGGRYRYSRGGGRGGRM